MDEPTSGVDVIARREFWNHITSLAKLGVTILVTTHFMDEAEYCNRISLFYKGETIALGTPYELKTKANADNMEQAFVNLIKESGNEHSQGFNKKRIFADYTRSQQHNYSFCSTVNLYFNLYVRD